MRRDADCSPLHFSCHLCCLCTFLALFCMMPTAEAQTKSAAPADRGNVKPASGQADGLRKEVLGLRQEIDTLKEKLDLDESFLRNKQDRLETISLDLTSKTYQRLDTDNGFFLVSVSDATPYLNGYKIHLNIGNPAYATYTHYALKIRYSKLFDWSKYTEAAYNLWNKSIQEKEISYPESLQPGAWNN